jgi:streptogramin lyase/photosystem II stability/assembly factor-like uncharacterized protein
LSSINDSPAFAIDPVTPTTLFTEDDGVFKSTDAGDTWTAAGSGVTADALAISPVTPSTLYAGTSGGGVFESTDGGLSWSPTNSGLPGWLVVVGGSTFYEVDALVIDPTTPSILYAGMDGNSAIPETVGAGVYKSTDAGGSWSPANSGIPRGIFTALTINPTTASTLYAGLEYADGSGASVYKSTDGGGSWTAANSGLTNTDVRAFAINRVTPSVLYAGTCGGGVFESTDAGGTWSATGLAGACISALAIDPVNPSTLYAGTYSGDAFKSTDAGGSWNAMNLGRECTPTYVTEFPLPDSMQPTSITAGPPTDGNLWFTEMDLSALTSKIGRITPDGTIKEFPLASFVEFEAPTSSQDITRGPDGNIWFTEYGSGKIGQILVNSPNTISEFPLPDSSMQPTSITAGPPTDGNVWFTEMDLSSLTSKIGRITPDGTIDEEFALPGSTTGNPLPSIMDLQLGGITAGSDGNLWFTGSFLDTQSFTSVTAIFSVTPSGNFTTFAIKSLSQPSGITAGPDGNLWFIESATTSNQVTHGSNGIGRILAASPNTITEFPVPGGGYLSAITAGPDRNVWFTGGNFGQIGRITPDGTITEFLVEIPSAPTGITAGSDGNLWLTNSLSFGLSFGQVLRVNLSILPPSAGQVCVTP